MPLSLENHQQEVNNIFDDFIDFEEKVRELTKKMEEVLKPNELLVYKSLFILKEDREKYLLIMPEKCKAEKCMLLRIHTYLLK